MEKILSLMVIPADKALHALYGAVLFAAAHFLVAPINALAAVAVVGVLKEVYDRFHPAHTPDWRDALATAAGGVIGFLAGA